MKQYGRTPSAVETPLPFPKALNDNKSRARRAGKKEVDEEFKNFSLEILDEKDNEVAHVCPHCNRPWFDDGVHNDV